jgi:Flp pilus assembly protein TadG
MVTASAQSATDAGARAVTDRTTRDSADRAADQRAGTGAERAINESFLGLGHARGAKEPGR